VAVAGRGVVVRRGSDAEGDGLGGQADQSAAEPDPVLFEPEQLRRVARSTGYPAPQPGQVSGRVTVPHVPGRAGAGARLPPTGAGW
jgi:hypothetical protein